MVIVVRIDAAGDAVEVLKAIDEQGRARSPRSATSAASRPASVVGPAREAARAQSVDDWFGADEALHFSVSALLAGTGYAAAAPFTERTGVRPGVGAGFALSLGIAKEIADAAG